MGVFKRFTNTFRSKINAVLNNIENPIESLDLQIQDANEQFNKAKTLSAQVIGNANRLKIELEKANKERNDLESKVEIAIKGGNEEFAKQIIERKLKADAKVSDLLRRSGDANDRAEKVKAELLEHESKLIDLRDYRAEAISRYNTAKVTRQLNEMPNADSNLDTTHIEDMIQKEEDYAYGLNDINESSSETSFEKTYTSVSVEAELAKYKEQFSKSE